MATQRDLRVRSSSAAVAWNMAAAVVGVALAALLEVLVIHRIEPPDSIPADAASAAVTTAAEAHMAPDAESP